ncbi:MAG: GMC family oxidoreductase N-terminal domain-containing protein [Pseudomonadota bacterium]
MFRNLTPAEAAAENWDVIIAGSSFSAMFFLRGLPAGLRVLILEKGPLQPHEDQVQNDFSVIEDIPVQNTSDTRKVWKAHSIFGGNSNCWWACTPRFHPNDFRMMTEYGVGQDWPVTYDTLDPFYAEVEQVMEVSGGGSDHILPRSTPFPFPPHTPSHTDFVLQAHSNDWFAQPTARSNGGSRAQCCGNGFCHLCPIDAKFTVLNGIDRFKRDTAAVVLGAEVRAVDIAGGVASGVLVRAGDGAEQRIAGGLVALGANAIFNAAILMRSGVKNPALGRYLHEQVGINVILDLETGPAKLFRRYVNPWPWVRAL